MSRWEKNCFYGDGLTIYFLIFIIGLFLGGLIFGGIFMDCDGVNLSEQTAIDVCQQLDGNQSIEFQVSSEGGKLVCEKPSYDNTQNIIIKSNSGGD